MEALTSRSNWNLEVLVFAEGGQPENPEKNPRSKARTNNKFNSYETASRIEPGSQMWEASAYPLRQPCSNKLTIVNQSGGEIRKLKNASIV